MKNCSILCKILIFKRNKIRFLLWTKIKISKVSWEIVYYHTWGKKLCNMKFKLWSDRKNDGMSPNVWVLFTSIEKKILIDDMYVEFTQRLERCIMKVESLTWCWTVTFSMSKHIILHRKNAKHKSHDSFFSFDDDNVEKNIRCQVRMANWISNEWRRKERKKREREKLRDEGKWVNKFLTLLFKMSKND